MTLRTATPADAAAIQAIMSPVIQNTTAMFSSIERTEAQWAAIIEQRARDGRAFYVAEVDGVVAGYAAYDQFRPGNDGYRFTMEHSIYLSEAAQGQGFGRILLIAIEEHARVAGHRSMIGAIDGDNTASIAFHTALGYKEVGRIPQSGFKFGRWLDALFLQKMLS
jgi:phosphinothricin acetyltransferase